MIQSLYPCFRHWTEQGTMWVYSDTHFGDKDLARNIPGRPSDEEHVALINKRVGKYDTLVLLGDVGDLEYARKLRGHKILICGNHDAGGTVYEDIFDEVYTGPIFISDKILLSHEPIDFPFAVNLHGHDHMKKWHGQNHVNVCSDACDYTLLHFQKFVKSGILGRVPNIHRQTIDAATRRARKRGHKLGQRKDVT